MSVSLQQIELDLAHAIKARDQITADTLRALKTRFQNEKIAKQNDLSEEEKYALLRSEAKKRKEAALAYEQGNRAELAQKELAELQVIQKYLPPEVSESEIVAYADAIIDSENLTQKDFGKGMGLLKKVFPGADGSLLSKILKNKLTK